MTDNWMQTLASREVGSRILRALGRRARAALLNARAFPTRLSAWLAFRRHIGEYQRRQHSFGKYHSWPTHHHHFPESRAEPTVAA